MYYCDFDADQEKARNMQEKLSKYGTLSELMMTTPHESIDEE